MSDFNIEKITREYMEARFTSVSYNEKEKEIQDWIHKLDNTRKIVADFKNRIGDPKGMKILDAGSGNGGTSIAFAEAGAQTIGVDIESELIEIAKNYALAQNVLSQFILYDGDTLPFEDNSFDAAVSVSVLEHTNDPIEYLSQIARVLKKNGHLYLAFPNRLWLKETHTGLWLITYLPRFLAVLVIKLFKRRPLEGNNLHFYNFWNFKKMLKQVNIKHNYNIEILSEHGKSKNILKIIFKKIINIFGIPHQAFLPHIMIILKKK